MTKPEKAQAVANLRAFLDELDEQTRQPGEPPLREAVAAQARERLAEMDAHADQDPYQCQGCGAVRYGSRWRDKGHACWRNEDGTFEEGGTFQ